MTKEVIAWNPPVEWVKEIIENAGNKIGSVHFNKRTNGDFRKMSYRLHVKNPSVALAPKGVKTQKICSICGCTEEKAHPACKAYMVADPNAKVKTVNKKKIDIANNQMTVLDTNKVVRDKSGEIVGRGAWRTVPLENVVRVSNGGTVYTIKRYKD